jgi:hypothetical protein
MVLIFALSIVWDGLGCGPCARNVCKSFLPSRTINHFPVEVEAYDRFTVRAPPPPHYNPNLCGLDKDDPAGNCSRASRERQPDEVSLG